MNNRQYYKAKEKGPEGPLGFPINLPKRGIQANAKGVKKTTWVFNKPPARGIRNLCQISAKLPGKLVQREKVEFYYFKGKSAEHLDQTGIRTQKRSGQ